MTELHPILLDGMRWGVSLLLLVVASGISIAEVIRLSCGPTWSPASSYTRVFAGIPVWSSSRERPPQGSRIWAWICPGLYWMRSDGRPEALCGRRGHPERGRRRLGPRPIRSSPLSKLAAGTRPLGKPCRSRHDCLYYKVGGSFCFPGDSCRYEVQRVQILYEGLAAI